jgi:hypothetical protein
MTVVTMDLPAHTAFEVRLPDTDVVVKALYRGTAMERYTAEGRKTSRVYGALDTLVPELMALEPFIGYGIPLAGPDRSADDTTRSAMWNAWKRETVKEGAARLRAVLRDVLAELIAEGLAEYTLPEKITFSQKAGCTLCPCSPGFVLDIRYAFDHRPIDLWIETPRADA